MLGSGTSSDLRYVYIFIENLQFLFSYPWYPPSTGCYRKQMTLLKQSGDFVCAGTALSLGTINSAYK